MESVTHSETYRASLWISSLALALVYGCSQPPGSQASGNVLSVSDLTKTEIGEPIASISQEIDGVVLAACGLGDVWRISSGQQVRVIRGPSTYNGSPQVAQSDKFIIIRRSIDRIAEIYPRRALLSLKPGEPLPEPRKVELPPGWKTFAFGSEILAASREGGTSEMTLVDLSDLSKITIDGARYPVAVDGKIFYLDQAKRVRSLRKISDEPTDSGKVARYLAGGGDKLIIVGDSVYLSDKSGDLSLPIARPWAIGMVDGAIWSWSRDSALVERFSNGRRSQLNLEVPRAVVRFLPVDDNRLVILHSSDGDLTRLLLVAYQDGKLHIEKQILISDVLLVQPFILDNLLYLSGQSGVYTLPIASDWGRARSG